MCTLKRSLLIVNSIENENQEKLGQPSTSSTNFSKLPRLGKCEVCDACDALYTCPKCEVKTCSLRCSKIHKTELECNGIRDRTKYIPLKKMTKMDFMSDYKFLEECTRYVENRKSDKIKYYTRYNKNLPQHLYKLQLAAAERKIFLKFLLPNFTKHKTNTTFYDWKTKIINWRIEWIFTNDGNLKFIDSRVCENDKISQILEKYLNPQSIINVCGKKSLEFYQSKRIGNLKLLLKSEGIKRSKNRYFELDSRKSLKDNLSGKTLVEFPCIHVFYEDGIQEFDIIDSDEDVNTEAIKFRIEMDEMYKKQKYLNNVGIEADVKTKQKINEKLKVEQKTRQKIKKESQNFLFSNESLLDEESSDSDEEIVPIKDDNNETNPFSLREFQ